MLTLTAFLGVFFGCLSILAAEATPTDTGPVVRTVTWDKEFQPTYPEAASYPRATALSDGRVRPNLCLGDIRRWVAAPLGHR
jgi:hypothetical protein